MSQREPPEVTVIIPARNEAATIGEIIGRVLVALPSSREVIVVDDGSADATAEVVRSLQASQPDVLLLRRAINGGKGRALRDGIARASGRYVIFQDADLELDAAVYPEMLALLREGHAAVYGSRFMVRAAAPWLTVLANRTLTLLANLLYGLRLSDMETGHKAFRADVLRSLSLRATSYEVEPEITALLARRGIPIREVPTIYRPRSRAEGKRIGLSDGIKALRTLIRYRL